jgi:hypothetical protein
MAIQAMLPDDGRPAHAIGFQPSTRSSGSAAIQAMLPDKGRPAHAIGFQPSTDSSGSVAIQAMPPDDVPTATSRDQRAWSIGTNPLSLLVVHILILWLRLSEYALQGADCCQS